MPTGALTRYRGGGQLVPYQPRSVFPLSRGARIGGNLAAAAEAAHMAQQYAAFMNQHVLSKMGGRRQMVPLKQTAAITRGKRKTGGRAVGARPGRARGKRAKQGKGGMKPDRHEKLKQSSGKPVARGKGYNSTASGVIVTHPRSRVPKWKLKRLGKYRNEVWQTVLISKSNRLAGSNNTLQTTRYPVKAPEALDSERTMTCMFTPFCSHFSGIHTTLMRKVNAAGTDLDHASTRFDVIQNKAGTERHDLDRLKQIDGIGATSIFYRGGYTGASAADIAAPSNYTQVKAHLDQLVKQVGIDLVFTASRAFPVVCSVSVVRRIQPAAAFTLTADDKKEFCNSVDNRGMDWKNYRTEWFHQFTLPALRTGKKIPTYSVKKVLKTNFMQTNSFNENTVAGDMADASATALGSNIHSTHTEIADGAVSGDFYILIKYRKKQQPQQFTYTQTIEADSDGTSARFPSASVTLPVVTEESFDVPTHDGITAADSSGDQFETGAPLTTNQGDESKASFYMHGKLKYCWAFRHDTEPVPSVTDGTNKRPQSLMIDPTYDPTDTTLGIYQQSPDHVDTS